MVVARGVPATAMPAQRAKAEPAASAAPEPRAPTRNVGQKVKEEPPSPALRAQRAPAKACVQAKEEVSQQLNSVMVMGHSGRAGRMGSRGLIESPGEEFHFVWSVFYPAESI